LEFNCRFGDPETQVILPLLKTDLLDIAQACAMGRLDVTAIQWHPGAAACVVLASAGYPGKGPQGRLIACEGAVFERPGVKLKGTPRVTRTDLKTGAIEVLADSYDGKPLVGPNDVTIDGQGRLYFTELNGAAVYRIDAPGRVTRILAAPDARSPNGIQVSPDDRKLYVVESNQAQGGPRLIRSYDLQADGTVRNMRVLYDFSPGRSADGISIDTRGNLYASAGMNQLRGTAETLDTKAGVYVISPEGTLLRFFPIPEDFITNNAFGGPDMKTLYVTAGKTLYKLQMDIAGLPR
jgi:gluconolactonase